MSETIHPITPQLLDALGGRRVPVSEITDTPLFDREVHPVTELIQGAYLWGTAEGDRIHGAGVFRHVQRVSRSAYYLGKALIESGDPRWQGLNLEFLVQAALLHDNIKLPSEILEKLDVQSQLALGLPSGYREIHPYADELEITRLRSLGLPTEVYNAIKGHDFPQEIKADRIWQVVLVADYMTGQEAGLIDERLADIHNRWIAKPREAGLPPRIEEDRFEIARKNILQVANGIFRTIGMTNREFIERFRLNEPESETPWEKFLRTHAENGTEAPAKAQVRLSFQSREGLQRI